MKYTRYDVKRRKNESFLFISIIIIILAAAFLIASVIANLTLKSKSQTSINESSGSVSTVNKDDIKFVIIQGGVFTKKENVDDTINILKPYGNPFSITEDNKTKVLLGIYKAADADDIIKTLSDKKIDNTKINIAIKKSEPCDEEIIDIIDGNIQLLNALNGKDVSAVKTDKFKGYCASLKNPSQVSKNISVFNDIRKYVNSMPSEIHKDKVSENYLYLYNIIGKLKEKAS